jgi:undecaprenyl-diphosphatase
MAIPLSEATLLGLVQGITDFLPISSDGHLALAQLLFGGQVDPAATVVLHLGTLSAILVVLRKRVLRALLEGARGVVRPSLLKETPGGRDAMVIAIATIPTAIVGLSLKNLSLGESGSPALIGLCFLGSAVAVGSTYWAPLGERDAPSHAGALLVGLAQGLAVLPGLSRSGMTMATLLWLGVTGERAFELAFLISLPAIAGAELLEARHVLHSGFGGTVLVYATLIAFAVGIGALHVVRSVLQRRVLAVFAIYLVPLGLATLAWGYARP